MAADVSGILEDVVIAPDLLSLSGRYNIRPSEPALLIRANGSARQAGYAHWGFRPPWMTDAYMREAKRGPFINARSETLFEARAFSDAGRQERCLILADGFYEPKGEKGTKREQHYFDAGGLVAFAGIETAFPEPTPDHRTANFAILTCMPNAQVEPVHGRMPVILPQASWADWLSPNTSADALNAMMQPWSGAPLDTWQVSTLINQRDAEGPGCIAPYKPPPAAEAPASAQGSLF
ncbi:MAG: SOS response-associated peptidase [Alphaproteobacteria bacterium]|nr:SOS response-associated peptidase [Alphaproteobacteria bacterium SS10]